MIDGDLGLCCTREEADLDFDFGSDDDPLVQRLGRVEYEQRLRVAEQRYRDRFPDDISTAGRKRGGRTGQDG